MFSRKKPKGHSTSSALVAKIPESDTISAEPDAVEPFEPVSVPCKDGVVVIGKGTRVSGSIGDCQVLEVFGVVEADVTAERLIVQNGGGICGNVHADNAEISGVVEGSLVAFEHLEINATGEVWADVKYRTLAVAKGAVLKGTIWLEDTVEQQIDEVQEGGEAQVGDRASFERDIAATNNTANTEPPPLNGHGAANGHLSLSSAGIQRHMKS